MQSQDNLGALDAFALLTFLAARAFLEYRIDWVVHLASLLSASGERDPVLAMKLNTVRSSCIHRSHSCVACLHAQRGIENVLELARLHKLRVFAPSTIAVFGPTTPKGLRSCCVQA